MIDLKHYPYKQYMQSNCKSLLDSNSFLRTWLAFKVRKFQKETPKSPDRHDSMCHPTPKLRDPIMGPYNLTKCQADTSLLTPSKVAVTEA